MINEVISLSNYKKPQIEELKSKGYVTYGKNNEGFTELIRLAKDSPTNSAVLHGLDRLVYGKGLAAKNADGQNAAMFAKAMTMIRPKDLRRSVIDSNRMANAAYLVTKVGDSCNIQHIPTQMIAPGIVNAEGDVVSYFYSTELGKKDGKIKEALEYPSFDINPKAKESIKYIKAYSPGSWYFDEPDYQGSIAYMDVEIENGKYHVNNVKTRFSAQTAITLFNGDPGKEKRQGVKNQITKEYSGSEGSSLVVNFVDKDGKAPEFNNFPIRDLHQQQEYISKEATNKILLGHGVIAPMLFGIKDSSGLGNNAEELETSFVLFNNMTIIPKQNIQIEGLEDIFRYYDITLDFYFKSLKPNEFIDDGVGAIQDEQEQALSAVKTPLDEFIELGEDALQDYELLSEAEAVDNELENEIENILLDEFNEKTTLQKIYELATYKLVGQGKATPTRDSSQDNENFAVRYRYKGKDSGKSTRSFCSSMLNANKLYRKEDIVRMEKMKVNPGFGKDGADTYSIWDYKGGGLLSKTHPGGTCKHFWQREIYLKKGSGSNRQANLEKKITVAESNRLGFRPQTNNKKVGTTPHSNYTKRF